MRNWEKYPIYIVGAAETPLGEVYDHTELSTVGIAVQETMAAELAHCNVQVNAVCPGIIWMPMWVAFAGKLSERNPFLKGRPAANAFKAITSIPTGNMQRVQQPGDIGLLAGFLTSDDSKRITGEAISIEATNPNT